MFYILGVWRQSELGATLGDRLRCLSGPPRWTHLSEQEGDGSKGKGPAVVVAEVRLAGLGLVQHFVVDVGDVENQSDHQGETCGTDTNLWSLGLYKQELIEPMAPTVA